jgi:hypothetical protein
VKRTGPVTQTGYSAGMDWTAPIDLYCERLGPGLWAEPLNAVSNLAFLLAAGLGFSVLRRSGRADPPVLALIALVAVIGVGSLLFHVFANGWSVIADVAPITVFIYGYLTLALRRFFGFRWPATIGLLALFFALSLAIGPTLSPLLGGSAAYVPPLAAMAATATALALLGHPAAILLLSASGVFLVSLTLRTLDGPLCPAWPIGTHFLWHLLNAVTLALLLLAALTPRRSQHTSPARSDRPTA